MLALDWNKVVRVCAEAKSEDARQRWVNLYNPACVGQACRTPGRVYLCDSGSKQWVSMTFYLSSFAPPLKLRRHAVGGQPCCRSYSLRKKEEGRKLSEAVLVKFEVSTGRSPTAALIPSDVALSLNTFLIRDFMDQYVSHAIE